MTLPPTFVSDLEQIVGAAFVTRDEAARTVYGQDGLKSPCLPDVVVMPGTTSEVAAVAESCDRLRVPLYVRGGGTGYSGGAVPVRGGVLMSMERFSRILEIDERNLLVVTEPNVVTARLQAEVEKLGLFYPPDPASLEESVIGGNIAECAGGPRAFKYGTTKRYVLGLEVVLPTGDVIRTGSKAVKSVVGYDLTQVIVGSEGTLGIITQAVLRLIPKPPAHITLRATFDSIEAAVEAVDELIRARVVPATLELVDGECLAALTRYLGGEELAPAGTAGLLILEVDGMPHAVADEAHLVEAACRAAGATEVLRAASEEERQAILAGPAGTLAGAEDRRLSEAEPGRRGSARTRARPLPTDRRPQPRVRRSHPLLRPCGRRQHPRQHHGGWRRPGGGGAGAAGAAAAVRGGRGAGGLDQRRARDRLHEGPVRVARAVARGDRALEAAQAGVRPPRHPEPGEDLSRVNDHVRSTK